MSAKKNNKSKQSPAYLFGGSILSVLVAYGFASWAVDNGSFFNYGLAVVFLGLAVKLIVQGVRTLIKK